MIDLVLPESYLMLQRLHAWPVKMFVHKEGADQTAMVLRLFPGIAVIYCFKLRWINLHVSEKSCEFQHLIWEYFSSISHVFQSLCFRILIIIFFCSVKVPINSLFMFFA